MAEGYGEQAGDVSYNSPDFRMIRNLAENVYQFSAAKNYQQLKDITLLLYDGNRLREESEFFKAVEELNLKYNKQWLSTERNTAIAGGQMAAQWVDIEENADIMPMLEYRTVGDSNVRAEHAALDGIIKPYDDPFWSTYYPPNGFNCRCGVRQRVDEAKPTPADKVHPPSIPEMFKTNLAQAGLIYPKEHPYYHGIPHAEITKAIAWLPPGNSYMSARLSNHDKIDIHVLAHQKSLPVNLGIADDLSKLGYTDIKLLPDLNENDIRLRAKFLPKGYVQPDPRKNPDAVLKDQSGRVYVSEFKHMTGFANFENRIKKAAKQAELVVIKLDFDKLPPIGMENIINKRLAKTETLKGVVVLDKKGDVLIERYR
jgi:SPP1 gp7 family putative phage head morphogenesis protein